MLRPPNFILHQRRPFVSFPLFLYPLPYLPIPPLIRSLSFVKLKRQKYKPKLKGPLPITVRLPNLQVCQGCGIPLQNTDQTKPGFIYRQKDATKDRAKEWKIKHANQIYERALREADQETLAKLSNPTEKVKQVEEREKDLGKEGDDVQPISLDTMKYHSIPPKDTLSNKDNRCRRCHELRYHSNPLPHTSKFLPPPQSFSSILSNIQKTNTHPGNPPLLVHVIDVVDFPLSFIPFTPPEGSKVIFAINRADSLCERASSMAHVRHYFKRQLPLTLEEAGINLEYWDVQPVSAKKGYGVQKLREMIFQLRNAESNVYFIGHTNVGKSSLITALVAESGFEITARMKSDYNHLSPTVSVFPHTTVGNVRIPLNAFRHPDGLRTRASLYDTPGIEGDSAYFNGFIDDEYTRAVSLLKVGGFQRPPDRLTPGRSMILGGMIRLDLLECAAHPNTPDNPHIRITPFTNLPVHQTSPEKAQLILEEPPSSFWSRKSKIEIVTKHAMAKHMLDALELEIKSTGNAERNTIEIVIAGLGFVAIGGNFERAKIKVWTPAGRGVGIRRPIVEKIGTGYSLDVVRKKKIGRMIMLGRKSTNAKLPPAELVE